MTTPIYKTTIYLIEVYLDYVNNYLTIAKWAEHNGLTLEQGIALHTLAKSVYLEHL